MSETLDTEHREEWGYRLADGTEVWQAEHKYGASIPALGDGGMRLRVRGVAIYDDGFMVRRITRMLRDDGEAEGATILRRESVIVRAPIETLALEPLTEEEAREEMCAVIRRHGLDPSTMVATSEDAHGYDVILRDPSESQPGARRRPAAVGELMRERREWPSREAGNEIRDAIGRYYSAFPFGAKTGSVGA